MKIPTMPQEGIQPGIATWWVSPYWVSFHHNTFGEQTGVVVGIYRTLENEVMALVASLPWPMPEGFLGMGNTVGVATEFYWVVPEDLEPIVFEQPKPPAKPQPRRAPPVYQPPPQSRQQPTGCIFATPPGYKPASNGANYVGGWIPGNTPVQPHKWT